MENKKIYIIGIGGTLMSGAAIMLKNEGNIVTGSDKKLYPPTSYILEDAGIEVFEGYDEKNVPDNIDLVIVGNVVSKGHPEMELILEKKIPYISFPEFLKKYYLKNYTPIVIAGTHGKTTTVSLAIWVYEVLKLNPSYLLGGIPGNFDKSIRITQKIKIPSNIRGKRMQHKRNQSPLPFIIEGDEYDTAYYDKVPKFYHYMPKIGVITSIEYDHADIYPNLDAIKDVFTHFINDIPEDGVLVYCDEIKDIDKLLVNSKSKKVSYGFDKNSDIRCIKYSVKKDKLKVKIQVFDEKYKFTLPFFGRHNILNFMAMIGTLTYFTNDFSQVQLALDSFKLPKRRQEIIYNKNDIIVIDDFAHHPTAIKETIKSIKMNYPKRRLIAIFEPRSNTSRQSIFKDEYLISFDGVSQLYIKEPEHHRLIDDKNLLKIDELVTELNDKNIKTFSAKSGIEIISLLKGKLKANDLVLIMSNGGFDGIYKSIEDIL